MTIDFYVDSVLPKMHGWCTPEKARALFDSVIQQKPEVCVEIGVFAGRSLCAIALALEQNGFGTVFGVDPWKPKESIRGWETDPANRNWWNAIDHDDILSHCVSSVNDLGVKARVRLVKSTSGEAATSWKLFQPDVNVNFLHIDGNHAAEIALFDVNAWVPLVSDGGIIFFDDIDWETTKIAQKRLDEMAERIVSIGNCGVFRKKAR